MGVRRYRFSIGDCHFNLDKQNALTVLLVNGIFTNGSQLEIHRWLAGHHLQCLLEELMAHKNIYEAFGRILREVMYVLAFVYGLQCVYYIFQSFWKYSEMTFDDLIREFNETKTEGVWILLF